MAQATATSGWTKIAIDDMESIWRGGFKRARAALGVTGFGLSVSDLPPNFDRTPPHVHTFDGQEEVYMVLEGSGWLDFSGNSGKEERVPIDFNNAVRVGPGTHRSTVAGPDGLRILIAGGTPGKPYVPFEPFEIGAREPSLAELPGIREVERTQNKRDWVALKYDEMEPIKGAEGVTMFPVRKKLGVSAFGVNVFDLDYGADYPLHDHIDSGQEEVYVVAVGEGQLELDGARVPVERHEMIRVGPEVERRWIPGEGGLGFVALGAPPGEVYQPPSR